VKIKTLLLFFVVSPLQSVLACPICEERQPKIARGLTHGAGPQSNWDWVIIALIGAVTLLTFIFSLKYLISPGEKNTDHIKQSILNNGCR
jgi:hypothetical protein